MASTVECDRAFPVADAKLSGWLDALAARSMRTALLDCLADAPGTLVVDIGDAAGLGRSAARALADVGRLNAGWPRARMLICPLDATRETQLRRAGVFRFAEPCASRAAASALADATQPPLRVREHLDPTPDAPAVARRIVGRACRDYGRPDLVDPAQLLVSELVTNGVTHAATPIDLTVLCRDGTVSFAVGDRNNRPPRRRAWVGPTEASGRGSLLLDRMARSWGHLPRVEGKIVWAELAA
jgi:hypothetical protein